MAPLEEHTRRRTQRILQEGVHERAREAAVDDAEEQEQPEAKQEVANDGESADEGGLARAQRHLQRAQSN